MDEGRYNFNAVKRWSNKFDVMMLDKVIIPINVRNTHWTLGVIFMEEKEIRYYDSYLKKFNERNILEAIWQWLFDEVSIKKGISLNKSEWKIWPVPETPQQINGYDCGVFTIMCADFLMDNISIRESTYSQANMEFFRQKILNDILRGELKYPNLKL